MSRLCGGDGCVEWVSVAGEDEWYKKHGRLDDPTTTSDEWYKKHGRLIDTNVKLNNSISEKELFVNQDAFNRDIHQEVEKIHEDRRGSSPSRSDQGVQQMNGTNNAAQCCTVS